jgi:hypothetical protein
MDDWVEYENDLKQARRWDWIYSGMIVVLVLGTVIIGALLLITW